MSGKRVMNRSKYGPTVATVVCCSMISLSQTRYGSGREPGAARQGRSRRWRSYHASSEAGSVRGGGGSGKIAGMDGRDSDHKTGEVGAAGGDGERRFGLRPI